MRRSLRRTSCHLHVTYAHTFSNNLRGEDFAVEVDGRVVALSVDLSPNLRTRNKNVNSYVDAVDLADRHADVEFVQLHERSVVEGLTRACEQVSEPDLRLLLSFGERGTFSYRVRMKPVPGGAQLTVLRPG